MATEVDDEGVDCFNLLQLELLPVTSTQISTLTRRDRILSQVYQYTMLPWSTKLYPFGFTCYRPVHQVTIEYKVVPLRYDNLLSSTP